MLTAIIFPRFHHHLQNNESETTEDSLKAVTRNNLWTKAEFEGDTNHWDKMADTTEKIRIGPGYKQSPLAVMRAAHWRS